jgi:hypothetical protein
MNLDDVLSELAGDEEALEALEFKDLEPLWHW